MKKMLLIILCLMPTLILGMAATSKKISNASEVRRRNVNRANVRRDSVLFKLPIIEDTQVLKDMIDEEGLEETAAELEKREKSLHDELGLVKFLLMTSKISDQAKNAFE